MRPRRRNRSPRGAGIKAGLTPSIARIAPHGERGLKLAHMIYAEDGPRTQTLREHNRNVALYASEALAPLHLSACGKLTGLLHDGKGTPAFQAYLRESAAWLAYEQGLREKPDTPPRKRGEVNHTFAGCIYLLDRYHRADDPRKLTAEILACAIGSHHGLFDCLSLDGRNGFLHRVRDTDRKQIQYENAKEAFETEISSEKELDTVMNQAAEEINTLCRQFLEHAPDSDSFFLFLSMLTRMITSALIYADRRDTAEFCDGRPGQYGDICPDWNRDIREFESRYAKFAGTDSPINRVRTLISGQCRKFAEEPDGRIYQMHVPTGGGKTLSSLRYCLYHADRYQKKRIIYVIPLLTILDQNAADIRTFLPDETVLEHHSDVVTEEMSSDELARYDLMRDRWNAPVIITTLVQILDILFSGKTQAIARMRALADAVIVFDEVQSVPRRMITLFNAALNFLSGYCGATILLSSATQPAFDEADTVPLQIARKEMVHLTDVQKSVFVRYQYHPWSQVQITEDELCARAKDIADTQSPLMIVCNTKSEAADIYRKLRGICPDADVMHLSAGMCKAHRKTVLETVSAKLHDIQTHQSSKKLILVTTQLVEAGVNLSFRSVIRLMAGCDNLVQTAGRCNRSNEYGTGDVYLCQLSGEHLEALPDIAKSREAMQKTIGEAGDEFDPESETFIRRFYENVMKDSKNVMNTENVMNYPMLGTSAAALLENNRPAVCADPDNGAYLMHQPFRTVGENFHVFGEDTLSLLVPYGPEGADLIEIIRSVIARTGFVSKALLRRAGDFSVTIYPWQKDLLERNGMLRTLSAGKNGQEKAALYAVFPDAYSEDTGLNVRACRSANDYIF